MMDKYLKVDEVAKKLKVKPVTIQRWCRSGRLESKKIGKNWYILDDKFEDDKKDITKIKLDLDLAFTHVCQDINFDLIKDIINYKDYIHCKKEIISTLNEELSLDYEPRKIELIDIPKNGFTLRPISIINFKDRVLYQALINSIVRQIDSKLSSSVYSYRVKTDNGEICYDKSPINSWKIFQNDLINCYKNEGYTYLLTTDITSYFENVNLQKLHGFLSDEELKINNEVITLLFKFLHSYTSTYGEIRGLTQGPLPSSILGNYYLHVIDNLEEVYGLKNMKYLRYMDDMNIFALNKSSLKKILKYIIKQLRVIDLSVSAKKTKIYSEKEISSVLEDNKKNAIEYNLRYGDTDMALGELKELFINSIKDADNINYRDLRFSLYRLKTYKDDYAVKPVLELLEDTAPASTEVADYLQNFINSNDKILDCIYEFLKDEDKNMYEWQEHHLLKLFFYSEKLKKEHIELIRRITHDSNKHWICRVIAIAVLSKHGEKIDVYTLMTHLHQKAYNYFITRAILVVVRKRLPSQFRSFASQVIKEFPDLEYTIKFLKESKNIEIL